MKMKIICILMLVTRKALVSRVIPKKIAHIINEVNFYIVNKWLAPQAIYRKEVANTKRV